MYWVEPINGNPALPRHYNQPTDYETREDAEAFQEHLAEHGIKSFIEEVEEECPQ